MSQSHQSTVATGKSTVAGEPEELLTQFEAQFDGGPNPRLDLEAALADGLGTLILLEARVHEAFGGRRAGSNGEADGVLEGQRRALLRQVSMLRAALQELRALMTPCDDPLVYGFVCAHSG